MVPTSLGADPLGGCLGIPIKLLVQLRFSKHGGIQTGWKLAKFNFDRFQDEKVCIHGEAELCLGDRLGTWDRRRPADGTAIVVPSAPHPDGEAGSLLFALS